MFLSRRQFLKVSAGTVAAVALADKALEKYILFCKDLLTRIDLLEQ